MYTRKIEMLSATRRFILVLAGARFSLQPWQPSTRRLLDVCHPTWKEISIRFLGSVSLKNAVSLCTVRREPVRFAKSFQTCWTLLSMPRTQDFTLLKSTKSMKNRWSIMHVGCCIKGFSYIYVYKRDNFCSENDVLLYELILNIHSYYTNDTLFLRKYSETEQRNKQE